jgi:uncharacterized membrane protein
VKEHAGLKIALSERNGGNHPTSSLHVMDWPHIHIVLNHFPIILAAVGTATALLGVFVKRRGIWMYSTASLTLAMVAVIPTYFTGPAAEHALNHPWYIARGAIHDHESSALISAVLVVLAGLIAAYAWRRLVRYHREASLPGLLRGTIVLTSVAATASIFYTSLLGGKIIHDSPVLNGPRPAGVAAPVAEPARDSSATSPR